uniref:CAAX prenyl protease 2/Lysostaphin resistance protein A-like domain-containing protein n=1 Tax=Oryza brachyantha TaxID=4533 RepID=J3MEI3_ORYBR
MTKMLIRRSSTRRICTTTKTSQNVAAGVTKLTVPSRGGWPGDTSRSGCRGGSTTTSPTSPSRSTTRSYGRWSTTGATPPPPPRPRGRSAKEGSGRWGSGRWSSSDESGSGGRGGRAWREVPSDLVEDEVVLYLQKGGEGSPSRKPGPKEVVVAVETPQDMQHQDPVDHWAVEVEVMKGIRHALHPLAVLTNGEVPLHEGAELRVQLKGASLGVAEELTLESQPGLACGAVGSPDDVLEIEGDGRKDPRHDDAVEDVIIEGIAAEGEEDLVSPATVGGGRGVEDDGDRGLDVLDADHLEVELSDHRITRVEASRTIGLGRARGGDGVGDVDDRRRLGGEKQEVLCLGNTVSQGIGLGALALLGEGGRLDLLLGRQGLGLCREESRRKGGIRGSSPVMILWIATFWFVGSWIVPFLAHAAGFSKETLTHRGQALYSLLTDITEGLAGIAILHHCLGRFRPLPPGWFEFNLKGRWYLDVALGCLLFPLVNFLSHININLVPMSSGPVAGVSSVEQSIVARDPVAMVLYAVVVTVCAPIWEEIVFRGFLLPSLTRYMPLPWSILVSAAAFALAHFNAQRVMPLVFLGVVMGGVFARSRNLLASMVLHSLWNGFVFLDLMK